MKILFDNYNTASSTESSYLANALANAGLQCAHWQREGISAFDMFDKFQPNVFVSKYEHLSEDALKCISQFKCKLILNVTGITKNEAEELQLMLKEMSIDLFFVFYNFNKPEGFKDVKCVQILPAVDIFVSSQEHKGPKIPYLLLADDSDFKTPEVGEVYHKIFLCDQQKATGFDASVNIMSLVGMSNVYENAFLIGKETGLICGQPFFELSLRLTGKCGIEITPKNQKEVSAFMEFLFPDLPGERKAAIEYVKSTILRKHTAFNRAERFCKQLGASEDIMVNIRKMQDSLVNQLHK